MNELQIDPEFTADTICDFIRDRVHEAGYERGIIGTSGGIDSTVTAYLTVKALGADNVIGLIMPHRNSSRRSTEHAQLAGRKLGIRTNVIDITPQIAAYFERFPDAGRLRRANKMARERMAILYDQSKAYDALVIGTGNRSEALLGYTTLWGDMAAAIVPIGNLYKTQVRQLAEYLQVPAPIIEKPPSPDLWQGQTDEGELGFSYHEADRILHGLKDLGLSVEEIADTTGLSQQLIERVREMVSASAFKRHMPPAAPIPQQPSRA